jgi:hypothetical protein
MGVCLSLGMAACDRAPMPIIPPAAAQPAPVEIATPSTRKSDCEARIRAATAEPALAGTPGMDAHRAELLARSKAEPLLFKRAPVPDPNPTIEVQSLRAQLAKSPSPGWALHGVYKTVMNRPDVARSLLLSEGYLYSEVPDLAAAFVDFVELHHLFNDPELVIQRGSNTYRAKKGAGFWYEYVDGPEQGQRARILLLDRVWPSGRDPGPPLHVDVRQVARDAGFDRLTVERITDKNVIGKARYGGDWVPALFKLDGTTLSLDCEAIPPDRVDAVEAARSLQKRRHRVIDSMRSAMVTMIGESLPFDEPRTEEGQQDGNLRPAWRWAYTHGWDSYKFNDDFYTVFDLSGRPKVPQVCIDFITDTIERASGTWWAQQAGERKRLRGGIDFDDVGIENRRSVDVFIRFAEDHPEWFDVYRLSEDERIRFFDRAPFFQHLAEHADRYMPGDVVAIHGPRSDGENHWHSFYVYDSDPLTGMPILLASNAGRPRIRTWEGEMRAAPRRSIHTRIRPRLDWLEQVIKLPEGVSQNAPPALISAPI